jgi:hypothetical protein
MKGFEKNSVDIDRITQARQPLYSSAAAQLVMEDRKACSELCDMA